MATSDYELQVVRRGNKQVVARWPPGDEDDLVSAILRRAKAEGVGAFRTEAHVLGVFETAIREAIHAVKSRVRP
jgi:hypothetical protein